MLEEFSKLPQFLQLCVGLGAALGAYFAVARGFKLRKIFANQDRDSGAVTADYVQQQLQITRKGVYERQEKFGLEVDQRYDRLETRVRDTEVAHAGVKSDISNLRNDSNNLRNEFNSLRNEISRNKHR